MNLRDETMDLGVHPHTKGFRVFSLRSPLYVKGTFKDPHVGVNAAALALRGGAMVGLGLINPFAALMPLLAPSNNKPLPCAQLLSQVRQAPTAPPPGVKQKPKAALSLDGAPVNKPAAGASSPAPANREARCHVAGQRSRIQGELMFSALPADWLNWSFGGGLSVVFLWLISVPPVRGRVDEAVTE